MNDCGPRVLIAGLPRLARDIVVRSARARAGRSSVSVLGRTRRLRRAVRRRDPQIVVVPMVGGELDAHARAVLDARCRFVVIGVDSSDGRARFYRVGREDETVEEFGLAALDGVIDALGGGSPQS
jgi:hypothetical protein